MDKVLVVGYAALGDLVFMLPALKALRDALPKARVVFATDDNLGSRELLPPLRLVDEIWRHSDARRLASRCAAERFDAALVTLAAPIRPFALALLRAPLRIGQLWPYPWLSKRALVAGQWERSLIFNRRLRVHEEDKHMAERHLELVSALGVPVPRAQDARPDLARDPDSEAFASELLKPVSGAVTVGIHLGPPGNHYRKMWPPERWAATARGLQRERPCRFVVLGGPEERPSVEAFRRDLPGPFVDLAGAVPLSRSIAVLRRCDVLLSADTGLAKLAMACRVPTVTVWGPTSRRDNGALWDRERHVEVTHPSPCDPVVALGMTRRPAAHDCLERVTPELVLAALRPVIEGLSA